jgi:alanine racemase
VTERTGLYEPVVSDLSLRPTYLEVDVGQLAANYASIRRRVGAADVMPVLKANAYGHGLVPVARLYEKLGARILGVAYLEEAIRLRESGVGASILVLGGILGSQIPLYLDHDLILAASSVDKLRNIDEIAGATGRVARVHLKVDTGMERLGVHWYSATPLLEASLTCRNVRVEGIFSHLANADAADLGHARLQLERFLEVTSFFERRSVPTPTRHLANSGGVAQLPEAWLDLVRPGILLYGVYPSADCRRTVDVAPALTWRSHVVYFKVIQAGNPVGYGSTWRSDHDVRAVTVPVGYGDGYPRRMSGRAEVLIAGRRHPVVGTICMDQVVVNLEQGTAYNGDDVVLLGANGHDRITVEELADWAGTIPYEILTGINTRVPRVYVGG